MTEPTQLTAEITLSVPSYRVLRYLYPNRYTRRYTWKCVMAKNLVRHPQYFLETRNKTANIYLTNFKQGNYKYSHRMVVWPRDQASLFITKHY